MRPIAICVAVGILCATAHAQSTSAQAEALFRRGRELVAQGKLAEACGAFESSQRLDPAISTLLNLADCREKNHQLASAWGLFIEVERQLRGKTDEISTKRSKTAAARVARIEPRLSHLAIAAKPIAGLEITRNGERVDIGSWNEPLPVDGGSYQIAAHAPGRTAWSTTVTVAPESDNQTVTVPELARPVATIAPVHVVKPAPPPVRRNRVPGFVTLGAGVVAIGASLVLGELALGKWHDAKAICGGDFTCDDAAQTAHATSLAHEASTRGWWATGVGIAGVASAAIGTYLLVRSPERDRGVALAPSASGGTIGVIAWGRF